MTKKTPMPPELMTEHEREIERRHVEIIILRSSGMTLEAIAENYVYPGRYTVRNIQRILRENNHE